MATNFVYNEHPRAKERAVEGPPTVRKTMRRIRPSKIGQFNTRLGLRITTSVGTMWCAYLFAALALVSLPAVLASGSPMLIVAWIAQTFLQLVLLPVIIVGQNIQAASSDDRAIATYKDAGAILDEAKQIQLHLASQDASIGALLDKIAALEKSLPGAAATS